MLVHLNGAPAVGKSSVSRMLVARHPGWLNCDIDVLRTMVGGWEDDFAAAGATIRPVAQSMIAAHLAAGGVVVLPQLLGVASELTAFRDLAKDQTYVHVLLDAPDEELLARWRDRPATDPWTSASRSVLEGLGGDAAVLAAAGRVRQVAAADGARVINVRGESPERTAIAVEALLPT